MKRTKATLLPSIFGMLLFVACSPEPGTETDRVDDQMQENRKEIANADDASEWMEERREASEEMRELREKLDVRLIREEKRLADGVEDAEKRAECESHIAELKANITRIDASIATLESSPNEDWQKVKAEGREVLDDIDNWFQKQAEKIDLNTDADADNDGH